MKCKHSWELIEQNHLTERSTSGKVISITYYYEFYCKKCLEIKRKTIETRKLKGGGK